MLGRRIYTLRFLPCLAVPVLSIALIASRCGGQPSQSGATHDAALAPAKTKHVPSATETVSRVAIQFMSALDDKGYAKACSVLETRRRGMARSLGAYGGASGSCSDGVAKIAETWTLNFPKVTAARATNEWEVSVQITGSGGEPVAVKVSKLEDDHWTVDDLCTGGKCYFTSY